MSDLSKLILSDEEQQLVNNTGWILTKRVIIDKVCQLLANAAESQKAIIEKEKDWLPDNIIRSTPKIAKGENYLQLPYVLLDHPRCFDRENIFAVRTMFWWGNFFSITLHLSGTYKERFQESIIANMDPQKHHFFICINENQWQHHFEVDNYIDVMAMTICDLLDVIEKKPFIKLAMKFPLQPWAALPALLESSFLEMIQLLKDQLPRR